MFKRKGIKNFLQDTVYSLNEHADIVVSLFEFTKRYITLGNWQRHCITFPMLIIVLCYLNSHGKQGYDGIYETMYMIIYDVYIS